MKKRVLAFASAIVMVITMVCVGGLSLPAAAADDGSNETGGLYDVYANGGTYGSETVSSTNAKLNANGDNAAAIGGAYGVGINRPGQESASFIVNGSNPEVVALGENTGYVGISSTSIGENNFGSKGIYDNVHTSSENPGINFGATIRMAPNMINFTLYFVAGKASECTVEVWVSNSNANDAQWRKIGIEQTVNAKGTLLSDIPVITCSPAAGQLSAQDEYVKFVFTHPTKASGWDHHFAKADWTWEQTVSTELITFDRSDVNSILTYLSDNANIGNNLNSQGVTNTSIAPHSKVIRFTSSLAGADAPTGRTMEAIFTSDVAALDYDIYNARFHVAYTPDSKYASYSWDDGKLFVSATGGDDWEAVAVDVVTESDSAAVDLAGWTNELEFSFADPDAITTKNIRYVKFQWTVKGTPTDGSSVNYQHMNLVQAEFDYLPNVTYKYDAIPQDETTTIMVNGFSVGYAIKELSDKSKLSYITSGAAKAYSQYGIRNDNDWADSDKDGVDDDTGLTQDEFMTAYSAFGATLELAENLKHFALYFVTQDSSCNNATNQVTAWISDSYGENAEWRQLALKKTWHAQGTQLSDVAVSSYEPADDEVLYPTDKYVKFAFTYPNNGRDWRYHFGKAEYTCANDQYVRDEFDFDDEKINELIPSRSANTTYKTNESNRGMTPGTHSLRFSSVSNTDSNTMQLIFSSDALDYDIKQFEMKTSICPDVAVVSGVNVAFSVSDTLDGTYTPVQNAYRRNVCPVETTWCTTTAYGFRDVDVDNVRYVKVDITVPAIAATSYFNIYHFSFMREPIVSTFYESEFVYRTVNAKSFAAQFNFLAGATEYTTIKAYAADTNHAEYYREIALESAAGKLDGATAAEAWESYVYTPAADAQLGNYIKFVISQPTDSTADSVQFMGLSYTADDAGLKAYDFSTLEIKQENNPVRRNQNIVTKADINNAADIGAYRYYYVHNTNEGMLVYDFDSLENFRVFISTKNDPAELDLRFYVAAKDDDAAYVQIETKIERGVRTEAGSFESYAFTPVDPADIPNGARYLKVLATGKQACYIVRLEGDQPADPFEYAVNIATAANGAVTVDDAAASFKQTVTVTATPDAGYVLQDLQVVAASGAEIAVTEDLTFVMPGEAVTVTPVFHAEAFTVTKGADSANGSFTVDTESAVSGTKVTVTPNANEGYQANTVAVVGVRFGEVEVTKEADGTFTFILPKDDVTVDVTFGVRELDSAISTVLGGQLRDDSATLGDGYRGLRFTAKAVFTKDGNTHTIEVDGTTYNVSSFGFLIMRKDRAEAFAAQALAEGKGTEMAIQNQLESGRYLKAVEAKKLISNELDGNTRTVQYSAVITTLTEELQYQWLLARPYYVCKNVETNETVYFYDSVIERDIYEIELSLLSLDTETTAQNNQFNEAVLLFNKSTTVSDEDWVTLANSHIKEGSVQVFIPNSRNFDGINSVIGGVKYAVEGVDYEIDYENGRIRRLPTGTVIRNYYDNALYALENELDAAVAAGQAFGGGAIPYPYAYNDVVYVSYDYVEQDEVNEAVSTHLKDYMVGRAGLSDDFKELVKAKAAAGETLTYLVIGDSISTGGDAMHDGYEWTYYGRFEAWLEQAYPGLEVDVVNYAVAGATSAGGLTHITAALADGIQPDLVSIAFGMNDQNLGSGETNKDADDYAAYIANYDAMLAYLKTNAPNAEVIGITSMPACPLWNGCAYDATATTTLASVKYAESLHAWGETNGLAVAPVNEAFVYSHDVAGKSWAELIITAINHPGQYGHGLYFEALKALF